MENSIELKSISELGGMNFFIPSYQRGYRWTEQQVKDLLDDIHEFGKNKDGFYCIQPLVVRKNLSKDNIDTFKDELKRIKDDENNDNLIFNVEQLIQKKTRWEVIDGQQRLTTIYILLSYLNPAEDKYSIKYDTRPNSEEFLTRDLIDLEIDITKNIDDTFACCKEEKRENDNIDYFHMIVAKHTIVQWFKNKDDSFKKTFLETLLNDVKFIWYESVEEKPTKVFTRLNIGKISLTNAELIKALFLNKSNFEGENYQQIRLLQQEIAIEWDTIEYTLQNDEFWLFLNNTGYDKPTRIDFIFDLICEKNSLLLSEEKYSELGFDNYRIFRYFYYLFKEKNEFTVRQYYISKCWKEIKTFFQIFQEWFNDLELYHYIGYLLAEQSISRLKINDIIDNWESAETKNIFISKFIITEIAKTLSQCKNLNKPYEVSGSPKTQCRPILLLHNIQTVINQNKTIKENEKYKLPVFYKFPFHLFKKEAWDVEHIDSHSENPLESVNEQKEWLKYSYDFIKDDLKDKIKNFLKPVNDENQGFDSLYSDIVSQTSSTNRLIDGKTEGEKTINEKDMLWNFTLLDSSTNKAYGNAIFPAKRRMIIAKDRGKKIEVDVDKNFKIIEKEGSIAFIPPCTKNVFLKYYNPTTNNLREWDKDDAKAYIKNIKTTLEQFQIEGGEND